MDLNFILLSIAIISCVYMACNIGANDVANAMGTSVGSKALTFKQAVMVAAVAEFAGAFLVGGHVSDTIRKGMLDPGMFQDMPMHLVFGMIAALVAAGVQHAEAEKVEKMASELGTAEWEADRKQFLMAQKLYSLDDQIKPADLMLWNEVIKNLGAVADESEKVGKILRLFISN